MKKILQLIFGSIIAILLFCIVNSQYFKALLNENDTPKIYQSSLSEIPNKQKQVSDKKPKTKNSVDDSTILNENQDPRDDDLLDLENNKEPPKTDKDSNSDEQLNQDDFVEDPEAVLDAVTEELNQDKFDIEKQQDSQDTMSKKSDKNNKNSAKNDFFATIDPKDDAELQKKSNDLLLDTEPDNSGLEASTTPSVIDNEKLLDAIPDDDNKPEFADDVDINIDEPFDTPQQTDKNMLDSDESEPQFADDIDISSVSDMLDNPQGKQESLDTDTNIDNITKKLSLPKRFFDISKTTISNNNNNNTKKKESLNLENESFTCHFEHSLDAVHQSQIYRLVLTPDSENGTPIKMQVKQKMELYQFLNKNLEDIDNYPSEFSVLRHFCRTMIVQKSVSEKY